MRLSSVKDSPYSSKILFANARYRAPLSESNEVYILRSYQTPQSLAQQSLTINKMSYQVLVLLSERLEDISMHAGEAGKDGTAQKWRSERLKNIEGEDGW